MAALLRLIESAGGTPWLACGSRPTDRRLSLEPFFCLGWHLSGFPYGRLKLYTCFWLKVIHLLRTKARHVKTSFAKKTEQRQVCRTNELFPTPSSAGVIQPLVLFSHWLSNAWSWGCSRQLSADVFAGEAMNNITDTNEMEDSCSQ